jgi:hypothetical protein
MIPAASRLERYRSRIVGAAESSGGASRSVCTEVFVVSEDAPGQWRVADRVKDEVSGPFAAEAAALGLAFDGVRRSPRWEIHVLDQFGTLMSSYNSEEDAMHVKVD